MSRRILVTGGAGFIGSHLCDALVDRGDEVIAMDNLITGNVDNVAHLIGRPGFRFGLSLLSRRLHYGLCVVIDAIKLLTRNSAFFKIFPQDPDGIAGCPCLFYLFLGAIHRLVIGIGMIGETVHIKNNKGGAAIMSQMGDDRANA